MQETNIAGLVTSRPSLMTKHQWLVRVALPLIVVGVIILVVCLYRRYQTLVSPVPVPQTQNGGQLQTQTDANEIFQKAFWQRPSADDLILHAERREWVSDTSGVRKWEWFLAIEPNPAFIASVKQRFSLANARIEPESYRSAPDWFRTSVKKDLQFLTSGDQALELIIFPDQKLVLAHGVGTGFATAGQ